MLLPASKAMRRPEAKAALDKDLNKLKNLLASKFKKSQTTGRRCTRSKKEKCSSARCISRGLVSLEALRLSSVQNKELQSHIRLLLHQKRDNMQIIWNGKWSKWRSFSIHSVAPDSQSFWTRHAHKSGYEDPVIPFERNFSAILSQVYCGSENRRKSCCETTGEKSHSWACSLHDFWRNELSTVKHRFWAQQWAWYVRNVCSDKRFYTERWRGKFSHVRHPVAASRACKCCIW